jgi:hypothetical protein
VTCREELAYAAGLYEGEGSMGAYLSKSNPTMPHLNLTIQMTNKYPLEAFVMILGFGKIYGPFKRDVQRKDIWRLNIQSFEEVQATVAALWYWLSPDRKRQASDTLIKWHVPRRGII